jgi:single-stranded DNA-binding protein
MPEGFEFSGQGRLNRVDTFTTKTGKSILTLVIEVNGSYPQLVPIKVFGRLAEQVDEWEPGDVLTFTGRLGGRDWNGKVYGEIVATTVDVVASKEQRTAGKHRDEHYTPDPDPTNGDDDVPF